MSNSQMVQEKNCVLIHIYVQREYIYTHVYVYIYRERWVGGQVGKEREP